jgi:hypothetical protein
MFRRLFEEKGMKTFTQCLKGLIAFTFICVPLQLSAASIASDEYQAVVKTAYDYFHGAARGDQAMLKSSFDTEYGDVKMLRVDKDSQRESVRTVPLGEFAGYFDKETKDTWNAQVLSIDIADNKMAMVKMDFKTSKTHYIDYLVMYKRNDEWRIVNKTFVAKPLASDE